MPEREPFTRTVPPGTYASEAIVKAGPDPRNVGADPAFFGRSTGELGAAVLPGQDVSMLDENEFFGIPVDAGSAAFMSSGFFRPARSGWKQLRRQRPGSDPNYYDDVLAAEYSGATRYLRHQPLADRPEAAAIIASSGWAMAIIPSCSALMRWASPFWR